MECKMTKIIQIKYINVFDDSEIIWLAPWLINVDKTLGIHQI